MVDPDAWKTISSTVIYESPWIKLRHDEMIMPDGIHGQYDVIIRPDFVLVIPLQNDIFFMVDQFRYPIRKRSLEFPEGSVESGEEPIDAARRELHEETGLRSESIKYLGFLYLANGNQTQKFHVFTAHDCVQEKNDREGSELDMVMKTVTIDDIKTLIRDGGIKDSPTVAAWSLYTLQKEDHG